MMAEDAKDEWESYWSGQEEAAVDTAAAGPSEDTMLTADTMVGRPAPDTEADDGDTLSSLSNLKPEKRKKPVTISRFLAWKTGIKNIIYEQSDDAQMLRLKKEHKKLTIAFRILAWVSLAVLVIALWSVMPESMSVVVFFMLTILTLGLIFAIGGTDAIINLSYAGEVLGRYAMLYLILAALVLIAITVVLGVNLYKNEMAIYNRYDRIMLKNKTRVYHKESTR